MISCAFNGRLGNNMFQIATVIAIAKKLNTEFAFPTTTWAGHRAHRNVDLSIFNYNYSQFELSHFDNLHSYNELDFHFNPIEVEDNTILSGFYQSWKYFEDIRESLINTYFYPSNTIVNSLSNYVISNNSLGISVRRGDYLMLQNNHCVLGIDYYQNAINKYFLDNTEEIYIFSDDIEWCQSVFGNEVHYVNDSIGVQLFLMARMKHLIISNSTFAWWGAYLNQNNGLIIAPNPWFGLSYVNKNTKDLYHPNWIQLNHTITTHPFQLTSNMYE